MELKDIPNINQGGCGIAAMKMYLERGKKDQIVFLYNKGYMMYPGDMPAFYNNERYFKRESATLQVPGHVCLLEQGTVNYIDSLGETDLSNYDYIHFASEKNLRQIIKNGDWAKLFVRDSVKL